MRRAPFSLPYPDVVPLLGRVIRGADVAGPHPVDPVRLAEAAVYHGVAYDVLAAAGDGRLELPAEQRRLLSDVVSVRLLDCAALRRELPALVGALGDPVLVKGPALAGRYYDDPRRRPFADLDLLVPRARLDAAVAALEPLGYRERQEFRPGFAGRHGHDVHLTRVAGARDLDVEVHWRIGDDPLGNALDHEHLASHAVSIDEGGTAVLVPDTPDQLLVVALHLLSDRAKRLTWVRDVERVATAAGDAEWSEAFARADGLGLLWVLHRALGYAREHLGVRRDAPRPAGPAPAWGPLRAVEDLDMRASTHVGRLAALPWRERPGYLSAVLVPTRAGLRGTVGGDGAPTWRLAARHASRTLAALAPRRR